MLNVRRLYVCIVKLFSAESQEVQVPASPRVETCSYQLDLLRTTPIYTPKDYRAMEHSLRLMPQISAF